MTSPKSRLFEFTSNIALSILAASAVVASAEFALRAFPSLLPSGSYGAGRYDPGLRMNVHADKVIYNKAHRVERTPNRFGFMDVDHSIAKPPETIRIGFFGDSYVEAIQVPLRETFFRRLPPEINGERVEPLAFGISGWGTLHSYLNYKVQASRFGLDIAAYVFVENDLGDNSFSIQESRGGSVSPKPFAELQTGDAGFSIKWIREPGSLAWWLRAAKFVQHRSLLAQVVWHRTRLLRRAGMAIHSNGPAQKMMAPASHHGPPEPTDLPSTWPPEFRNYAQELDSSEFFARGGQAARV